jgi:hypothetical protein
LLFGYCGSKLLDEAQPWRVCDVASRTHSPLRPSSHHFTLWKPISFQPYNTKIIMREAIMKPSFRSIYCEVGAATRPVTNNSLSLQPQGVSSHAASCPPWFGEQMTALVSHQCGLAVLGQISHLPFLLYTSHLFPSERISPSFASLLCHCISIFLFTATGNVRYA